MRVYRIRRYSSNGNGGPKCYHHADVEAPRWNTALKMAKEGKVHNWRWIDTFDSSDEEYEYYEYLYRVD
jgi:hypothetical protein